jgi:hypothetical protein
MLAGDVVKFDFDLVRMVLLVSEPEVACAMKSQIRN